MSLLDSLVVWWPMDGASGNEVDVHGGNTLVETSGTIDSAVGKVNGARDFESADTEYFTIADNAALSVGNIDATWAVWINFESIIVSRIIFRKGGAATAAGLEYVLYYDQGLANLRFQVSDGTTTAAVLGGAVSNATWYFVVVDHDSVGNVIGIQVNDGTRVTTAHTTGIQDSTGPFEVGASSVQALYHDGLIDELAMWKRALTTPERTELYNGGAGLPYPLSSGAARRLALARYHRPVEIGRAGGMVS